MLGTRAEKPKVVAFWKLSIDFNDGEERSRRVKWTLRVGGIGEMYAAEDHCWRDHTSLFRKADCDRH